MAHTTSRVRRMYDVAQSHSAPRRGQGVITIEVKGGAVIDVKGIPGGYQYEILDHDVECIEGEPPFEALYLATVNILIRATSPGRAVEAITHIMSGYDMADGTLVDWDYATLDGWRRCPRFVSTDLGIHNIAELLDLLNTYTGR